MRWQFRGGIEEKDRKAFLFTNVVDATGRRYDMPVVVGASRKSFIGKIDDSEVAQRYLWGVEMTAEIEARAAALSPRIDLDYEMECRCGARNCRGVINGKDWMKPELQEKYKGWFCWFLQRKIDALPSSRRPA